MDRLRYWFWSQLNLLLRHAQSFVIPPPRKAYVVAASPGLHRRRIDNKGFTLIEILVTILITTIVSGIAAEVVTNVIPTVHADSSLEMAVAQLRQAREGAIDQRRNFVVTFKGTNEITVDRKELDGTTSTRISDVFLGAGVIYTLITGIRDTPDGFGNTLAVNFAGGNTITFLGDGTVIDSTNKLVNGTVFMAIPGKPLTARAVTVMGATSRIKGYRYNGSKWF